MATVDRARAFCLLSRTVGLAYQSGQQGVVFGTSVRSPLLICYSQRCQAGSGSALTTTTPPNSSLAAKSLLVDTLGLVSSTWPLEQLNVLYMVRIFCILWL
jgi:glucose-6-phosphate-specific signal transduction histidine kinase